jgi:hypothetical protein
LPVLPIINYQSGPIPINANFECPTDGPAAIYIAGSVWTGQTNTMIGIAISLDGRGIGTVQIYSNASSTHRAVTPTLIPVQISIGTHTLSLAPLNAATVSDINDFFVASMVY